MDILDNTPAHWSLPALAASDHKYTRGHALLLGGAEMTGAARLAAVAAQRVGAGMVTLLAPAVAWPIYAASLLSTITRPYSAPLWQQLVADARVTAMLIGPGAGHSDITRAALQSALASAKPLLLDADALTLLADEPLLHPALTHAILTPHEGEYAALAKAWKLDATGDKPARALALAKATGSIVLLKGTDTYIASPNGTIAHNHNAPPWLATAGTGDVLAGIVTGLRAQGMGAFDAACAAAWLHGHAAQQFGPGMVAEDLLGALPEALKAVHS